MVTHHEEEGILAGEIFGEQDGVTVAEGLGLHDEGDLIEVIGDGCGEIALCAGGDDDGGRFDATGEDFIKKKRGDGFSLAGGTHEGLQGEMLLIQSCGGDDSFLNLHGMFGKSKDIERQ